MGIWRRGDGLARAEEGLGRNPCWLRLSFLAKFLRATKLENTLLNVGKTFA